MDTEQIIHNWLQAIVDTASLHDLDAHMNLISKRVKVKGIPGFDSIGYDDWFRQCEHEFATKLISDISYEGMKIRVATENNIMFKTWEKLVASDGTVKAQGIEVLLEKEDDGKWRVIQERILPEDEARHDGLIPANS